MQDQSLDEAVQSVVLPNHTEKIKDDIDHVMKAYPISGEQDYVLQFYPTAYQEITNPGSLSPDFEYISV